MSHIVEGETYHIRYVCQRALTGSVIETLYADIAVNHRHEGKTTAHKRHTTAFHLSFINLVVKGIECEDSLSRSLTHLLKIGESCPVKHFLSVGFCISKSAATITSSHWIAVSIGDRKSLGTHDNSFVEQTTGERRLTEGANATTTCTLSENGYVIGIAAKLCDILFDPLQGFYLVEDTVVARYMMRTFCRKGRMYEESKHTEAVVDGNEHHVLGTPFLSVELRLRAEAFAITATINPQGNRELLVNLPRSFRPYVQIQTVLTEGRFFAITPLSVITTRILNSLIAGTTKSVADLHTLPGYDGLRLFPTVFLDRRCSVRNTTINIHIRIVVSQDTLNLTAFNRQHRVVLRICRHCNHEQKR